MGGFPTSVANNFCDQPFDWKTVLIYCPHPVYLFLNQEMEDDDDDECQRFKSGCGGGKWRKGVNKKSELYHYCIFEYYYYYIVHFKAGSDIVDYLFRSKLDRPESGTIGQA
jgi:hypothetical protein